MSREPGDAPRHVAALRKRIENIAHTDQVRANIIIRTLDPPTVLAPDIPDLFVALGLPTPSPIPVVADDHQIAQKLHAVSQPDSDRAHDLVDLQLLEATCTLSDDHVARTCARLFAFRHKQKWPPVIEAGPEWTTIYAAACEGLSVLPDLDAAISWVNTYIAKLHHGDPNLERHGPELIPLVR